MTVFRGYLKGAVRQKTVIFLYLAIFLGLGILMTWTMDEQPGNSFEAEALQMAVIDRDHSELSEGLTEYLGESQELVEVQDDSSILQEELYYGNIQYVLVIPEGFQEDFLEAVETDGDTSKLLQGTGRPGSTQSYYAGELAESYLSGAVLYLKAGYSAQETAAHMENLEISGGTVERAEGSSEMSKLAGTLQYLPYILTALSCYVIGFVMLDYQKIDIKRRLAVSAVSSAKRLFEMLLAFCVIGVGFYVVSFLLVWLMNPGSTFSDPNLFYYALNILTMVLVGLSIAFLVVHVAGSANGVNGLANVIALGMSFLCGVFIPSSMLSASVQNIAKFLPVYWYEQNNTLLGTHTVLTDAMLQNFVSALEYQLLFAAAVLALAIVIRKARER